MKKLTRFAAISLFALVSTTGSPAQNTASAQPVGPPQPEAVHVFYLKNSLVANDSNEILTSIRLLLPPRLRVYLDTRQNAILASATPDEVRQIQQIIDALDRPTSKADPEPARTSFRLTYTVSELDNGKRISLQHYTTVIAEGGHTTLKDSTNVPVRTGPAALTTGNVVQFSYLDVGINFESALDNSSNGERLRAKIEEASAIADVQDGMQNPIKRQASLELTAYLQPGKPLVLGSLDVPGSARHVEIEALLEPVR